MIIHYQYLLVQRNEENLREKFEITININYIIYYVLGADFRFEKLASVFKALDDEIVMLTSLGVANDYF